MPNNYSWFEKALGGVALWLMLAAAAYLTLKLVQHGGSVACV